MPGMYPDDEVVEIFGEKVMYPGLDPETHKFTDGDFSDPLKKPSHIPAATFNLLLDNMENFIRDMGLEPNNTEPNQIKKAIRQGIYTKQEIDDKQNALINMMYKSGYWYGRRYTATPWPVPAAGDTWTANSRKAYDFETNKIWIWNGTQWVADETLPVSNGTTIGVSDKFLDITDNGYPGKAIYSGDKKSWDFYPDKYNEEIIKRAVIMPGLAESCFVSDAAVLSLYRRIPMDGRTISINDSRVERLLRYCLIPHATAISNVDIIGMYLTNEYYEDHAAWLAANKTRPTPAANGVYLVIPDGSGIFLRGANQHGGHKAADGTLYDGGAIGKYQTDKLKRHIHSISAFRATGNFGLPEGGHYYFSYPLTSEPAGDSDKETAPVSLSVLFVITY